MMNRTRFTQEQIIGVLNDHQAVAEPQTPPRQTATSSMADSRLVWLRGQDLNL